MTTTSRQVIVGKTIALEIDVRDSTGQRSDADSLPEVAIIDETDYVRKTMSTSGVMRIDTGRYRFNYTVPAGANTGVWTDHWRAVLNGFTTEARLNFIVLTAGADIEVAGAQIGDPATIRYSEEEIIGINNLLAELKARLMNDVKIETTDAYGNIKYVDCSVFTNEELVWFLECSLQEFNEFPHFTDFRFDNELIYRRYSYVIVEGAFLLASAAKMLTEAGREFTISDNGITMNPPPLSATLNNELAQFVGPHRELVKNIKWSIKPHPIGFGSFRVLAVSPAFLRLRHLRQRRII
jgi:hypothetical protein